MKTKPAILVIMFFTFCNFYCNNVTSQTITNEEAFFYFVKIYNYSVTTPVNSGGGYSQCGNDLLTHYAYVFDNFNYLQSRNDEFKKHEYTNSITAKFNAELAKVNFERKFSVSCQGSLGEYSFENSSFPINFTEKQYKIGYRIPFYDDDCYMKIYVGEISNLADFNWNLAYPKEKAQNLISNRKYSNGQINRTIYFKLTYSIENKTSYPANYATNLNGSNIIIKLYSIDIYNDEYLTNKLGSIKSTKSSSDNMNNQSYIYYFIRNEQLIGEWEGKGEASGSSISIGNDYRFMWKDPSGSYSGSAEATVQEKTFTEEEIERVLEKIQRNMGNIKVTLCNKGMGLSLDSNKDRKSSLILYNAGMKFFAWAGGESYYEKK